LEAVVVPRFDPNIAHLQNTQGLVFVVDSNDRDRIGEARDELHRMVNEVRGWVLHGALSGCLKHRS
jgi:hypothetical protein